MNSNQKLRSTKEETVILTTARNIYITAVHLFVDWLEGWGVSRITQILLKVFSTKHGQRMGLSSELLTFGVDPDKKGKI